MKAIQYVAPWLAAAAIGGAVALAPVASAAGPAASAPAATAGTAGTDPLVPFGTNPRSPYDFGYHVSDHDEAKTPFHSICVRRAVKNPFANVSAATSHPTNARSTNPTAGSKTGTKRKMMRRSNHVSSI